MHDIAQFLSALTAPFVKAAGALSPTIANIGGHALGRGDFIMAAILVSAVAMVLSSGFWAVGLKLYFKNRRQGLDAEIARLKTAVLFRDTVIATSSDAVVILTKDKSPPMSFGRGRELLLGCLEGQNADQVEKAIDAILLEGTGFNCIARLPNGRPVSLRGRPIGGRAAIFATEESDSSHANLDFQAVLNALPTPIWLRDKNLNLKWANDAFVMSSDKPNLEQALASNIALDRTERDMALSASEGNETLDAKRYVSMGGERHVIAFRLRALKDNSLACMAIDLTETSGAAAKLQMDIESYGDVLDKMPSAIAIFGANQRLETFNSAYAKLWDLPERWLKSRPTQGEILDILRATRKLPEHRDFAAWKCSQIELFDNTDAIPEEVWHLPNGRSMRKSVHTHPLGNVTLSFEDISDALQMQSSYNSLLKVQRATLDTLNDGVAVFGPDACLKIYNTAFQDLWKFDDTELENEPHLKNLAKHCAGRIGRDETWTIISAGINAENPEKYNDWASIARMDGHTVSLSLIRLPDGGTMVTFSDVTNYLRFEAGLRAGTAMAA